MVILKSFKNVIVIDNCDQVPSQEDKISIETRFLNKIVNGDTVCAIEYYDQGVKVQTTSNNIEGGLITVDSLKYLKVNQKSIYKRLNIPTETN